MRPNPQLAEFWRVHPEYQGKAKRMSEFTLSVVTITPATFSNRAVFQQPDGSDFVLTSSSYATYDPAYAGYEIINQQYPTMLQNGGVYNLNNTTGTQGPAVGIGISLTVLVGGGAMPASLGGGTNYVGIVPGAVWSWPLLIPAGSFFQVLLDAPNASGTPGPTYVNFLGVAVDL